MLLWLLNSAWINLLLNCVQISLFFNIFNYYYNIPRARYWKHRLLCDYQRASSYFWQKILRERNFRNISPASYPRSSLFYDIAHLFPTNYATSKHSYITVMIDECFRPRSCNSAGGGCLVLDALPTIDSSIITVTSSKRPVCFLESRGNGKQKQNGKRNRRNEKEKIRFRHMPFA